ncbi:MAG TPA: hypothetical protein VI233_07210 [Puia sp.]
MKKIITILSALLIVTGLKAQKSNVQKETVKPAVDSLVNKGGVRSGAAGGAVVKEQKGAKIAPAALKYAPAAKIAPADKSSGQTAGHK